TLGPIIPNTPPVEPLPPAPSRDQLARVHTGMQGVTTTTGQLGTVGSWGAELWMLNSADDRAKTLQAHKAAGLTHITVAILCHYNESGVAYPGETACNNDYTNDYDTLRSRLEEIVRAGLYPVLMMGADEIPFDTVAASFPAIVNALRTNPAG